MKFILLLLVLSLHRIESKPKMSVIVKIDDSSTVSTFSDGEENLPATDDDINLFFGSMDNFYDAVKKAKGREPNAIYYRSPTPGDLYTKNQWAPVSKNLRVENVLVGKSYHAATYTVKTQEFHNPSGDSMEVDTCLNSTEYTTIITTWEGDGITEFTNVTIDVSVEFVELGNSVVSAGSTWGRNLVEAKPVTITSNRDCTKLLKPDQRVRAELELTFRCVDVTATYAMSLSGQVVPYYEPAHREHSNSSIESKISSVMDAAGIPNIKHFKQTITVAHYTNIRMKLTDMDTGLLF